MFEHYQLHGLQVILYPVGHVGIGSVNYKTILLLGLTFYGIFPLNRPNSLIFSSKVLGGFNYILKVPFHIPHNMKYISFSVS
jgi:hypothetical protein